MRLLQLLNKCGPLFLLATSTLIFILSAAMIAMHRGGAETLVLSGHFGPPYGFQDEQIDSLQTVPDPSTNAVFDAKRLIGRKFDDSTVQTDMEHWPLNVVEDSSLPESKVGQTSESNPFTSAEVDYRNVVFDTQELLGRDATTKSVQNDIKFYPFKVIEKSSKPHVKVETGAVKGDKMLTSGEISALNKMEETTETYHAIQGEGDVTFSTPPTLAPSLLEILSPSVVRLHPSSVRAEGAYRGVPVQEGGQEQLEITLGHPAQDTLPLPQEVNLDVGGFATRSRREAESSCLCRLIIPPQILLLPGYIILLLTSLFAYCALGLYYLAVSIYLQQTLKLRYLTFPCFSPRPPSCTLWCPPACSCHSPCAWLATRWSCMVGPPPC